MDTGRARPSLEQADRLLREHGIDPGEVPLPDPGERPPDAAIPTDALDDEEVATGRIRTCQARTRTDRLSVDYDNTPEETASRGAGDEAHALGG